MKKRKKNKEKEKNHFYYPKITAIFIYLYFYVFWIICRDYVYGYFLIKVRLVTYFSPLHICESISISIKIHLHNLMVVWLY